MNSMNKWKVIAPLGLLAAAGAAAALLLKKRTARTRPPRPIRKRTRRARSR